MNTRDHLNHPIIIVAAGRSGSKLLRSIIGSHPETAYFPREINYIWRRGNIFYPTDELQPQHARPEVKQYIRGRFESFAQGSSASRIIEKTCANSLRVSFVHEVIPEATIVHLIRDGRAVAESARRRWSAPPEAGYLFEKLRWVPIPDVPFYGLRWLRYQVGRWQSADGAQTSWGPRFAGMDEVVREHSLIEVCGIQWRACVRTAEEQMKQLPAERVYTVRYEDLIQQPLETTRRLFAHLQLEFVAESERFVQETISEENLEKWRERLTDEELEKLLPHIESELQLRGYAIS